MKGRSPKNYHKDLNASDITESQGTSVDPLKAVRPHMVENGVRLAAQPGYPNRKIINRLAEIFATSIIAERN